MGSDTKELGFRDRLAAVIGDQDPYPWAESIGIGKSTFAGSWNRGAMPQTKTLLKIAQNTDISLNWLLTGRGPQRIDLEASHAVSRHPCVVCDTKQTYPTTPQERPKGCAGQSVTVGDADEMRPVSQEAYVRVPHHGIQNHDGQLLRSDQVVDVLSFKMGWITQTMGLDPWRLALVTVYGDSMEPTLQEGDLMLLDRRGFLAPGRVSNDAIYVLFRGQDLIAKRLQCGFDGSVTIQSDNPVYRTQVLSGEQSATLQIIGRVVWVGRRV